METLFGLDYPTLWFLVVCGLLSGYAILDGFDFGAGAWHLFFRKETSRQVALAAIGPVWSGNEVWLVVGGGALFAGFPVMYATLFSAMYLPFMIFLVVLILRAVSIEFRNENTGKTWRKSWDWIYGISSSLLPILLGIVLGNVLQGLPIDGEQIYRGNELLDFLNPYAILIGFTALAFVMTHGSIYLMLKSEGLLFERLKRLVRWSLGIFVFLFALVSIYTIDSVPNVMYKLNEYPILYLLPILAVLSIANVPRLITKHRFRIAFVFSCLSIALLFGLVAMALFPNLLISSFDPAYNLDIYNASASTKSLKIMLIMVAIGGPLVSAYTFFVYRTFRGKINLNDGGYGH